MTPDRQLDDLETILADARAHWQAERRAGLPISERIGASIPWWLVIIAVAAFLLSIPHTVEVFGRTTPVVGVVAPAFVELGLLYCAANRYKLKLEGKRPGVIGIAFEGIVLIASVFVNTAGSLIAVASGTTLANMSLEAIMGGLGTLPIMNQVALVLVPFAGLMIPAGTWVAGEGLARLFLESRAIRDDEWVSAAPGVEYRALYNALIARGVPARHAERRAAAYIAGRHRQLDQQPDRRVRSAGKVEMAEYAGPDSGSEAESRDTSGLGRGEARARLDALFRDNPASVHLPVETLMELTGAKKSAVYEWRKMRTNGHQSE